MRDINLIKRYIAEIVVKGIDIQDILNDFQSEDWDVWIEGNR